METVTISLERYHDLLEKTYKLDDKIKELQELINANGVSIGITQTPMPWFTKHRLPYVLYSNSAIVQTLAKENERLFCELEDAKKKGEFNQTR